MSLFARSCITRAAALRAPTLALRASSSSLRAPAVPRRWRSDTSGESKEERLRVLLEEALEPTELSVVDVSGGCGASFRVRVVSPRFAGQSMLAQHRAVNALLKEELASVHALQLETAASK